MLKLTEAELAEMGYTRRELFGGRQFYWGYPRLMIYDTYSNRSYVRGLAGDIEAYPQTKEDLLTLIRLFTPPRED